MTMSTSPFWMNGSRLAETVSVHLMSSSAIPSSDAMILPISTSKPSGCRSVRSSPKRGWSNFVPIVIVPASASVSHGGAFREGGLPAQASRWSRRRRLRRPEAQPASARAPAAAKATRVSRVLFMSYQSFAVNRTARGGPSFRVSWPRCGGRGVSVLEDLRQEVLRSLALRVREELLGGRLFDDLRRRP